MGRRDRLLCGFQGTRAFGFGLLCDQLIFGVATLRATPTSPQPQPAAGTRSAAPGLSDRPLSWPSLLLSPSYPHPTCPAGEAPGPRWEQRGGRATRPPATPLVQATHLTSQQLPGAWCNPPPGKPFTCHLTVPKRDSWDLNRGLPGHKAQVFITYPEVTREGHTHHQWFHVQPQTENNSQRTASALNNSQRTASVLSMHTFFLSFPKRCSITSVHVASHTVLGGNLDTTESRKVCVAQRRMLRHVYTCPRGTSYQSPVASEG